MDILDIQGITVDIPDIRVDIPDITAIIVVAYRVMPCRMSAWSCAAIRGSSLGSCSIIVTSMRTAIVEAWIPVDVPSRGQDGIITFLFRPAFAPAPIACRTRLTTPAIGTRASSTRCSRYPLRHAAVLNELRFDCRRSSTTAPFAACTSAVTRTLLIACLPPS